MSVISLNSVIPRAQSFIIVISASDLPLHTIKFCSVVFGVTLRLLVIYTSSSSLMKNKRRRLPATTVINLPRSIAAVCIALGSRIVHSTRWRFLRIAILPTPPAFNALVRGVPRRNIANVGMEKLDWCGYDGEKILKIHLVVLTECTNVTLTDRQTDGHRITA